MSAALEFAVPAVRLRLAPRRWVRTPLIASSWYSCGVQRCNASAASAPLPVLNACSPKRYTELARASCRERVCNDVQIAVVHASLHKKQQTTIKINKRTHSCNELKQQSRQ